MSASFDKHKHKLVPAALALLGLILAAVFHRPLVDWFVPKKSSSPSTTASLAASAPESAAPAHRGLPALPEQTYPEPVLASVRAALEAYEEIRAALAQDTVEGLGASGKRLSQSLHAAHGGLGSAPEEVVQRFTAAATAADEAGRAKDIEDARRRFATLSDALVSIVASD